MTQDLGDTITQMARGARAAFAVSALLSPDIKTRILHQAATFCCQDEEAILRANALDMREAEASGRNAAYLDRLYVDAPRLRAMTEALQAIADQPDPIGTVLESWDRPNGLHIEKVRIPLGVIGIIYESRPNVTLDAAALCLKSGNTVLLRCGSDSLQTSLALIRGLHHALNQAGVTRDVAQLIPVPDRAAVPLLLGQRDWIDVVIPRGGRGLVAEVAQSATMPVIKHLDGLCHLYIDQDADRERALSVTLNAKMRRPAVCGAVETVLIHRAVLETIGAPLVEILLAEGCEIRGDADIASLDPRILPATSQDWDTEYLAPIVSMAAVTSLEAATAHIARHSSHHTDGIITENPEAVASFNRHVDSAIVMHNTSTQFADGGEFGFGAEIGISTDRFHVRGPVGAQHLTTTTYRVSSPEGTGLRR
ncbi:MAG: glutamate-5-semialdehyde dehydrogenase [Alphaproteobacteria bacterium]